MRAPQKNWALKVSTLIVVTACFAVMASTLLISQNFRHLLTLWGEDVQMTVYLKEDLPEESRQGIIQKLEETGKVGKVRFINQEEALSDFRNQLASYAPDVSRDEELLKLIPSSLQFPLSDNISTEAQMGTLQSLSDMLIQMDGVDDVSFGQDWIEKYGAVVRTIETTLSVLCLIILAATLFVMSNAIRASVASRKEEIVVLEMIGATPIMIRKPFMLEGATLGGSSAVLALILSFTLYVGIKNLLLNRLSFMQIGEHFQFLGPVIAVAFILIGTGLGAFGSYLCVRRINDGFAGSQRS